MEQIEASLKLKSLIEELNNKLIEREELIPLMLLTVFSKTNMFLIGEPGVGKSYIVRIVVNAFASDKCKYFEYLVMEHTEPEEVFGTPNNRKMTVIDSNIVFLDEMFKGRSGILNSLLGILNEKIFFDRNSANILNLPLISLFGASNEFPSDSALKPFDDRLLMRYDVSRIQNEENFIKLIGRDYDRNKEVLNTFTLEELGEVHSNAKDITIPYEIKRTISQLKDLIITYRVEISDRKIDLATNNILKVSAYLNGRKAVDISDLFLFMHIGWKRYEDRKKIKDAIFDTIFFNRSFIDKTLLEIEEVLSQIESTIKNKLIEILKYELNFTGEDATTNFNSYLNVAKVSVSNLECIMNGYIDNKTQAKKHGILYLRNHYKTVLETEKAIEQNVFVLNYVNETFDSKNLEALDKLEKIAQEHLEKISYFIDKNKNVYDYNNNKWKIENGL